MSRTTTNGVIRLPESRWCPSTASFAKIVDAMMIDAQRQITDASHIVRRLAWFVRHRRRFSNLNRQREKSRRMRAAAAPGARVALPRWKYSRVAPETIPFVVLPHQKWASKLASECLGRTHRVISPGHYPTTLLPPTTSTRKREHREPPVNYVYKAFHKTAVP